MPRITAYVLVFCFLCSSYAAWGQDRSNPFEITPRLPKVEGGTVRPTAERPDYTPFDIRRGSHAAGSSGPAGIIPDVNAAAKTGLGASPAAVPDGRRQSGPLVIQSTDPNKGKGSILAIQLILLVALASLWVLFGNILRQCMRGTVNDSLMNQIYQRRSGGEETALWICYLFFFLAGGFFLYLFAVRHDISLNQSIWWSWLTYSLIIAAAVGLKQWLVWAFGRLFPVRKETSRYAFALMVFLILMGILFVPINLGVSYAPEHLRDIFLYGGLGMAAFVYLAHLARGLLIVGPLIAARPVHILLYICAVEVAPIMLVYRYLDNTLV